MIGPAQEHPNLGPVAMPLTPDPGNEMHGRSDFWIHGDNPDMNQTASQGCIIMSRPTREAIAASECRELVVSV